MQGQGTGPPHDAIAGPPAAAGPLSPRAVIVAGLPGAGVGRVLRGLARSGVQIAGPGCAEGPEDPALLGFHRQAWRSVAPATRPPGDGLDWVSPEPRSAPLAAGFAAAARRLAGERAAAGGRWGFRVPADLAVLDLWAATLAGARFLLVARPAWALADAWQRPGSDHFLRHPVAAYRAWLRAYEELLRFHDRHPDRCRLVATGTPGPERLEWLGLPAPSGADREPLAAGPARSDALDPRTALTAAAFPECGRLWDRLERAADPARPPAAPGCDPLAALRPPAPGAVVDVSIVVPTFNDAVYLIDALGSVAACRPPGAEVLVVDDGSTDPESRRILEGLRGLGIAILDRPNRGLSAARNAGIARARGRFVLPLDADNRIRPGFVESALARFAAEPDLGVVYTDRALFGAREGRVRVPEFDHARLLCGNFIDACAVFRREVWEDLGGYDEALPCWEDWEFWIHASVRGWRFAHLDRVGFDYRVRPGSLNGRSPTPVARQRLRRRILLRHRATLHEHLPGRVGAVARRLDRALPARWRPGWRAATTNVYWHLLWEGYGPGGFLTWRRPRAAEAVNAASWPED